MKKALFTLLLFPLFSIAQPTNWQSRGIGGGGALFCPSISPLDANNIYLQCDMSEVFHTTNKGGSWDIIPFHEMISTGGINTVEFTSNANMLYAVNLDYITDERFPVKSADGGQSWSPTSADPTGADTWYLSADPQSTTRLLVASYDELFFSNNGGTSFQSVFSMSDFHIAGVFWDGMNIYVGTRQGLLVSTNNGASFSMSATAGIPAGSGFISFTGAKLGGTTRLMGTIADQADLYPGIKALDIGICTGMLKLDVGAGNWANVYNNIDPNHELFLISSATNDINTYYVGGTNTNNSFPVVYKTTNGGTNWSEIFLGVNNQNITTGWSGYQGDENWWFGEIIFGLKAAPNDANTLIITDFGYAHVTSDGGANWNQAYVQATDQNPAGSPTPTGQSYTGNGLENTASWYMHWSDNNNLFTGYTDITAIRSTDGGQKWSKNYSGITYNTVYQIIEAPNGTLYAAVSSVHDMYQSTYLQDNRIDNGSGAILYSTNNGQDWNILHDFNMPVIWMALNPNNANELYASVINSANGGIYKTANLGNNASSTWAITGTPPRTEGHPYNIRVLNDGTLISSWSGRRDNTGFTPSSGIFSSVNGGSSWQDISDAGMYYWTKDIIIDPHDATQNTWYVAVHSGWGGAPNDLGGLYKTTNRGTNWVRIFDSYRVESATIHPTNANEIYVTTESDGLWYSNNLTSNSPTFSNLDEYPFQHPTRVFFNPYNYHDIWTTTFGNGMRLGIDGSVSNGISENQLTSADIRVYPNPAVNELTIVSKNILSSWIIADQLGQIVAEGTTNSVQLTINTKTLNSGSYTLTTTDQNGKTGTQKVVIFK
nr:T9SS type A sorting domain-containing protein [uncultured Fluviicola sp.]